MNANANDQLSKTEIGADEVRGDATRKDAIAQSEIGDSALIHEEIHTDPIEIPPGSEQTSFPSSEFADPSQVAEEANRSEGRDSNPDLITGRPGSHPVGTGVGAATGGVAGAAIGAFAGPVGAVIGTAIGAIAGGYTGKGIAESIDPSEEDAYWREHHANQPHAVEGSTYEEFAPAYRAGYTGFRADKPFDVAEEDLRTQYEGGPQLTNEEISLAMPGDADSTVGSGSSKELPQDSSRAVPWDQGGRDAARAAYVRVGQRHAGTHK